MDFRAFQMVQDFGAISCHNTVVTGSWAAFGFFVDKVLPACEELGTSYHGGKVVKGVPSFLWTFLEESTRSRHLPT